VKPVYVSGLLRKLSEQLIFVMLQMVLLRNFDHIFKLSGVTFGYL